MELTDLMNNDWVNVKVGDHYFPIVVRPLSFDKTNALNPDTFSPIPITEDILIKMGFEKKKTMWYIKDTFMGIEFKDGTITKCIFGHDMIYLPGLHAIKYVHQLQHALRLCGRADFANNFEL